MSIIHPTANYILNVGGTIIYSQRCEKVYMCFYDLQKAFDSVHYSVPLKRLYEAGINGRASKLVYSPKSMVKVDGSMSVEFSKALSSPTEISTFIHVDDIRTISSSRAILQAN